MYLISVAVASTMSQQVPYQHKECLNASRHMSVLTVASHLLCYTSGELPTDEIQQVCHLHGVLSGVFRGERREVSFVVACLTFEPE